MHKKNEERKKPERVSALPVSLPLSCFTTSKATTIHSLSTKLLQTGLPPSRVNVNVTEEHLTLCKLKHQHPTGPVDVLFTVIIDSSFHQSVMFAHHSLQEGVFANIPHMLKTAEQVVKGARS